MLAAVSVGHLVAGEPIEGVDSERCLSGDEWSSGGIGVRVLHPEGSVDGNDASCVLLIEAGERRALLTGDIEWRAESSLLEGDQLPTVDLVTMPHHGSRTSSTPGFVRRLAPDWAIASAGFDNRWGFPKPDIVARWRSGGAEVLTTATSGAVTARLCADGRPVDVRQHRRAAWRSWHED